MTTTDPATPDLGAGGDDRPTTRAGGFDLRSVRFSEYGVVWVTLALFVLLWITSDVFFTTANLRNVIDQQSLILIAGSAMTLTLIAGNFDISLSATHITASIAAAMTMNATGSMSLAILAGVGVGIGFGLVNGVIVTWVGVNSFIATLATSFVFFGLAFLLSDRSIIRVEDRDFSQLARGRDFFLTNASWIAFVVVILFSLLLERTSFGRHVFAAGGNPEAARLAGVRVNQVVLTTFVLAAASAGLAGALLASRTLTAQPSDDFSFVFSVLTAVIIGGTSIAGGEGAVWRTVVGAFFIALLTNGFNLHQIDPIIQRLVQGGVIVAAVAADNWTRGRRTT